MWWNKFKADWDRTIVQNITFRLVTAVLAVVIIAEGLVITALYDKQRVVFIPPKIDREFWISSEGASKSYLESMGEFVTNKVMNITPTNVVDRFNSILPYVASENYNAVKASLATQADYVKRGGISQTYYIQYVEPIDGQNVIHVKGELKKETAGTMKSHGISFVWIKYRMTGGKFEIEDILVNQNTLNPFANTTQAAGAGAAPSGTPAR